MPDAFDTARRRLRRVRVLEALNLTVPTSTEAEQRLRLLPTLGLSADNDVDETGDSADPALIDAAVSVALARVTEPALDHSTAVMLAGQVLAADHQWARLAQLASVVGDLSARLKTERAWLSVALNSLELVLRNQRRQARDVLQVSLGQGGTSDPVVSQRTVTNLSDALVATGMLEWLRTGSTSGLNSAQSMAIRANNGSALEVAALLVAYASASFASELRRVVPEAWPAADNALLRYVNRRGQIPLFPAQVKAIRQGAIGPDSAVVAMPTSSGKTLLAELKIAFKLAAKAGSRAIYLAPYRVLARQVEGDLRREMRSLNVEVRDLGTAFDLSMAGLEQASEIPDVGIMTPERLDGLMRLAFSDRRGAEGARAYLTSVVLLVVDEAHLVATSGRGARLELLLTRWRQQFPECSVLALSGVAGAVEQFGAWLEAESIVGGSRPTGSIELVWRKNGDLSQRFGGQIAKVTELPRTKVAGNDAADLALRIPHRYAPVLVIETTRPIAEGFARRVWERSARQAAAWRETLTDQDRAALDSAATEARIAFSPDHPLVGMLQDGIAFHHAGLPTNVLQRIEDLARRRLLRIVAATTTVAEGAHLPFQVVIIPHLNFQSDSGHLDKSLYLNIVGRAGRAGVAMEGIVVVLDSDARTLQGYVTGTLWNDDETVELSSRLPAAFATRSGFAGRDSERDISSQVLAWLGEPGSYADDQSLSLASQTFAGLNYLDAEELAEPIADVLEELQERGLAIAASPFRLTNLGLRSRLAGLGPASCVRLDSALSEWSDEFIAGLEGLTVLDEDIARAIARLVFETEEVLENGLWLRREFKTDRERWTYVRSTRGAGAWPYGEELFEVDIDLLTAWILGESFADLADLAPTFPRGLFSSTTSGGRAADAADLVGRLAYPAAWAWLGAVALLSDRAENIPGWIRSAIASGVPSEVAVHVVEDVGLARPAAVSVSGSLSPRWDDAASELRELSEPEISQLANVSPDDLRRLLDWQTRAP